MQWAIENASVIGGEYSGDGMIIRSEQVKTLEEVRMPNFENLMLEHLRKFTPLHSKSLGETGMRSLIQLGVERAKTNRLTNRGPVKFYIETCILLGFDFDTDPQYPELGVILRDESIPDQIMRADAAHEWLTNYLQAVGGPDRGFAKEALRRARKTSFPYRRVTNFREDAIRLMREHHPEKVEYLGEGVLENLLRRAFEEATKYEV